MNLPELSELFLTNKLKLKKGKIIIIEYDIKIIKLLISLKNKINLNLYKNIVDIIKKDVKLADLIISSFYKDIDFYNTDLIYYIVCYKSKELNNILKLYINGKIKITNKNFNEYNLFHYLLKYNLYDSCILLINAISENKIKYNLNFNNLKHIIKGENLELVKRLSKIIDFKKYLFKTDKYGASLFHYTAENATLEIFEYLLNYVDIEKFGVDNYGNNLLYYASYNNNYKIMELLLKHHNFNINDINNDGDQVIISICVNNNLNMLKLFLKYDGNINLKNINIFEQDIMFYIKDDNRLLLFKIITKYINIKNLNFYHDNEIFKLSNLKS